MRTLKFRIWNTKGKCFYTSDHVKANFFNFIEKMPDQPIMQFTGLLDRHGKEIYEGDIVAIKDTNNHVVHFHNGMSGWFTGEKESICQYGLGLIHNQSEVIGNVLENEELLNL